MVTQTRRRNVVGDDYDLTVAADVAVMPVSRLYVGTYSLSDINYSVRAIGDIRRCAYYGAERYPTAPAGVRW